MKMALLVLAALGLAVVLFQFFGQDTDIKGRVALGPASTMEDISISQIRDGATIFTMHAVKAIMEKDNDIALTTVKIAFPEKGLTLASNAGLFNTETKNLRLDGDIKASTADYDIVANTLYWDSARNKIYSNEKVTIVGKAFYVEGQQLDAGNSEATLTNNVKAVFSGKK